MAGVQVRRVGTQVVVRLSGSVGDDARADLEAALEEVQRLALGRVCVDLDDATSLEGAGIDFLVACHQRWRLRLVNTPRELRRRLRAVS